METKYIPVPFINYVRPMLMLEGVQVLNEKLEIGTGHSQLIITCKKGENLEKRIYIGATYVGVGSSALEVEKNNVESILLSIETISQDLDSCLTQLSGKHSVSVRDVQKESAPHSQKMLLKVASFSALIGSLLTFLVTRFLF